MTVSYNGLWKMLIDKNMYKKDLAAKLNISSATMAKMGKGENVSMDVLQKICDYRQAKQEMKEYQTAKYNIEQFLKKEEQDRQAEKQKTEEKAI